MIERMNPVAPRKRGERSQGLYRRPKVAARGRQGLAAAVCSAALASGCAAVRDLNLFSAEQDVELGTQAFQEVVTQNEIVESGPQVQQAQRVTERLIASAKELDPEVSNSFPWEVVVIQDDKTVNAFCLPGGKMAVYTGILPVTQDDTGLAVVMGHEIAHATLRHGTERMTRTIPIETAIGFLQNENHAQIANVLAQLGIGLPWGRSDELEADRVGLMYMAKAGYDPRQAVGFWQRMAELSGGQGEGLAEYFSTHPADSRRIAQIQELMPEALKLYESAQGAPTP